MSERDGAPVASAAGAETEAGTFGRRLSAARTRAGMTVTEVAARLRLHPKQVRAIEEENLAALPEAAYVRGFLRSYARIVGVDAAPLLEDFNAKVAPPANSVVDGMTHTRDYSPVKAAAREQASRTVVLGLALVALIALGAIGWYATRQAGEVPPPVKEAPKKAEAAESASVQAAAPTPPASDASAPAAELASMPQAVANEPAAPAASPPALLTLQFGGVSWVEVTDANGKVLLSQLARAGEVHQPSGAPPLVVVIGDASKATVSVRGEPMDLEPVTRSNVARFSVK